MTTPHLPCATQVRNLQRWLPRATSDAIHEAVANAVRHDHLSSFDALDANGNGYLDAGELLPLMQVWLVLHYSFHLLARVSFRSANAIPFRRRSFLFDPASPQKKTFLPFPTYCHPRCSLHTLFFFFNQQDLMSGAAAAQLVHPDSVVAAKASGSSQGEQAASDQRVTSSPTSDRVTSSQLQRLANAFDRNGDGQISRDEFAECVN